MNIIKVGQRGVITLPQKVRKVLGITKGGLLGIHEKEGKVILEPQYDSNDPILADIREGLEDIRKGKFIKFSSIKEFDKKLKEYDAD